MSGFVFVRFLGIYNSLVNRIMPRLTYQFVALSISMALITNGIFAAGPDLNKAQGFAQNSANATHFLENKGQVKQTDGSPAEI